MKRYSFGMVVTGTATAYVDAETKEEACKKLENGEWSSESESQETDWALPDWGETETHISSIEEIK